MYTEEEIEKIWLENTSIAMKLANASVSLIATSSSLREEAREYAIHGISRRLGIIRSCLMFFFNEIPPDLAEESSLENRSAGNAHLHAFLLNCVGVCDNIAWLIAYQRDLDKTMDFAKKDTRKGIGIFLPRFQRHLPPNVTAKVKAYGSWFENISAQRDPVAHRIPPYIIPYWLVDSTGTRDFTPTYASSLRDGPVIPLHTQCIADAGAVLEITEALLADISTLTP